MRIVRKVTPETLPLPSTLSDSVLTGQETLLRITRSGFTLDYMPLSRAEWRNFPSAVDPCRMAADNNCIVLAAYDEHQYIGLCCAVLTAYNWCDILDIRVDTSYRRTGTAGMMLDAVERFARNHGMRGLRIAASEDNPALCQFCQHKGFVLQGIDRCALIYTERERAKPMARRACALYFYLTFQN